MFTSDTRFCVLDYETYSEADLKKVGASEYARHPSTEILCLAFRAGLPEELKSTPTLSWSPFRPSPALDLFKEILHDPSVVLIAHNAYFEQVITRHVMGINVPVDRWYCTSAVAASLALPRKLEGAAKVLSLPVEKDMSGHRLMLKWSKPRTPSKHNPSTRHTDSDELDRLIAYCKTDVDTEVELFLKTPVMSKCERAVWLLDQKINHRGVLVDRHLVAKALELIEIETKNLSERLSQATGGEIKSPKRVAALLDFLNTNGCYLENLQAKTVADTLKSDMPTGVAREVLEIRQAASKSSTAKYQAFQRQSASDGRLRGSLVYHAASTGRWGGSGVQLQNLPRQTIKGVDSAAEYIREGDLDFIRLLYGSPMEVFSNCLRSVLIAPEGKVLDVADYAAIEVRVLFWLAGHDSGVKAFREGRDLYKELAATIFNTSLEKVGSYHRFIGKQATLGAGYGLGYKKFMQTFANYNQVVDEETARAAVDAYRKVHYPVPKLWKKLEAAALMAIKNPYKTYSVNRTRWWVNRGFLWCELPSGRRLAYFSPSVENEPSPYGGELRPVLYHFGVDARTKQWCKQKTWGGVLTENCFSSNTLVLTSRGWVPIIDVRLTDRVFDGVEWVEHGGVINQGLKEVGEWLGVQVTANHLIHVGEGWQSVINLDEATTSKSLKSARALVPWWLRNQVLASIAAPFASAIVAQSTQLRPVHLDAGLKTVGGVDTKRQEKNDSGMPILCQTKKSFICGCIATLAWFHAAAIQSVQRIKTMAHVGLKFGRLGKKIAAVFSNMQKHFRAGITQLWTSIESTITIATGQGISGLLPAWSITGTVAGQFFLNFEGRKFVLWNSGKGIAQNGKATAPLSGTSSVGKPRNKLWITTGKQKPVYDLINSGPRHQFVISTNGGPVVVHNCIQAISRDLMAEAMLRIERAGPWEIVLSVHDELIAERDPLFGGSNEEFCDLMSELPDWAEGLPIRCEGFETVRYRK